MDKGHLTTDKLLLTMEKKLTAIYSRANKEVSEKMAEYLGGLKDKEKQLQEAIKAAKSPEERTKAEAAYKSFMENATLKNAHYNALAKSMAENLKNVNQTAMAYVNGQLPEVYALNYNAVGGDISGKVKGYSFDLVDASTVKTLATKDETLLPYKTVDGKKDVRWNTKAVNSEILQGILQGESIPDISKRLTHVTEMNLASAIRNARTSTTSAENRGRMDSFHRAEDMGIRMVKVWMATNDERTREEHLELDGQEREIDEPFENSLGEIMYPGDPDADPANVYNCRCTMVTRVLGFEFSQPQDTEEDIALEEETAVVNGHDITAEWTRREDKFAFEIEDVINAQGFDGKPLVVSAEEFDKAVKEANDGKGFIAQRVYSAPDQETLDLYREELYSGKWYVDCSDGGARFGKGMYTVSDNSGRLNEYLVGEIDMYKWENEVEKENPFSFIETLTLDPSAKVINYTDLDELRSIGGIEKRLIASDLIPENLKNTFSKWVEDEGDVKDLPKNLQKLGTTLQDKAEKYLKMDYGSLATVFGYDAIRVPERFVGNTEYTVILNRTKVIFKGE